ncbi:MAG TPA: hypothetical protein PK765_00925 [bacterium]|nr:hypothetical protein [bacterium]
MSLLLLSFLSGILTVFAPCAFFVSLATVSCAVAKTRPGHITILIGSFAVAWMAMILSASSLTSFHIIPVEVWRAVSGGLLASVGIMLVFPRARIFRCVWRFQEDQGGSAGCREGLAVSTLSGISLGIAFATGFPLRANIALDILEREPVLGFATLVLFMLGFAFTLLFAAELAQTVLRQFATGRCIRSPLRRPVGFLLLVVSLVFAFGWDAPVESWFVERGWDRITPFERALSELRLQEG